MIKIFEKFNEPEVREEYYKNGQKKIESWFLNGKEHREDGPSVQGWYENGQKWYETWFLNGEYHKEDGAAHQSWHSNGQNWYKLWYLNDNIYYTREDWLDGLKKIGSPNYEEQRMLLDMEKYNL